MIVKCVVWSQTSFVEKVCNIHVGRPEGKRQLARSGRRCEDNIKMDLRKKRFGGVDWIHLTWDRDRWRNVVNTVMNLRVS
jgi:hypothetical protein